MCSQSEIPLLRLSGDKGQGWHKVNVSLHGQDTPSEFRLRLDGVVRASYLSDAALDDISVTHGPC